MFYWRQCYVESKLSRFRFQLYAPIGVPFIPRKMMCMSNPRLEISNDGDKWTIRTITMIRTAEATFTLNEEYEEHMPAGVVLKVLLFLYYFFKISRSSKLIIITC